MCVGFNADTMQESKGIVLMRGDLHNAKQLNTNDAQYLVNQLNLFYTDQERLALVECFNKTPSAFDFGKLLDLASSVPLK